MAERHGIPPIPASCKYPQCGCPGVQGIHFQGCYLVRSFALTGVDDRRCGACGQELAAHAFSDVEGPTPTCGTAE